MKKIILFSFVFFSSILFSQNIRCSDLVDYVIQNADYSDSVTCFDSSMLVKVTKYDLESSSIVIAYLKKDEYDYRGKPYVFCGISSYNWSNFKYEGMSNSWGKSFHTYIMDYKCNCY